uniref:PHD-type domain-containing protein n=1 Tax=Syphacia muris TaxID=451379 RepID=A0A0N5AQ18_9BILA
MLGGCCVCADENGWDANPLVYCDGPNCEVAVHQGCYGIIKVPEGEWYCAKCADLLTHMKLNGGENVMEMHESPRCELCPFGNGALKRTDSGVQLAIIGWAHVICALYIPEVRFGDVHSMDPVILTDVPLERSIIFIMLIIYLSINAWYLMACKLFRYQQPCYLCLERGERKQALQGACMSCNKIGCKRVFHVTCAQAEGLLCEEGAGSKNVKYCGYCSQHAKKAVCFSIF